MMVDFIGRSLDCGHRRYHGSLFDEFTLAANLAGG
jgi:hypothetical protein